MILPSHGTAAVPCPDIEDGRPDRGLIGRGGDVPTIRQIRSSVAYRALARCVKREEPEVCWLCGRPIDPTLPYRDPTTGKVNPMSWSLDHVVPVSEHPELALVRDLARAAHFRCNSARGDRAPKRNTPAPFRTSRKW